MQACFHLQCQGYQGSEPVKQKDEKMERMKTKKEMKAARTEACEAGALYERVTGNERLLRSEGGFAGFAWYRGSASASRLLRSVETVKSQAWACQPEANRKAHLEVLYFSTHAVRAWHRLEGS